jgi:hypothetical protein
MVRRSRAVLAAVVIATAAAAGCGAGGDDHAAAVIAAADATIASDTARVAVSVDVPAGESTQPVEASGKFDLTRRLGALQLDVGTLVPGSTGDAAVVDLIVDKSVIYMRFPLLSDLLPDVKEWLKLDVASLAELGDLPVDISQLQQADPTQSIAWLRGASSNVEEVGKDELRGDTVTHYWAELDLGKAAAAAGATLGDLKGKVPVDVWIDEHDRMRKLQLDLADAPGATEGATGALVLELYDFGVPVGDITAPAADAVTDLAEVLGR